MGVLVFVFPQFTHNTWLFNIHYIGAFTYISVLFKTNNSTNNSDMNTVAENK